MFGIKGKWWEENYPSKIASCFNEYWGYPADSEIEERIMKPDVNKIRIIIGWIYVYLFLGLAVVRTMTVGNFIVLLILAIISFFLDIWNRKGL